MHDDLIEIAAADSVENVRILFDADVQTNPAVFDAAQNLRRFLSTVASVDEKKIRYIPLEGLSGGKEGLDDYLASVGDRTKIPSVFTNLLAGSKPLPRAVKKQEAAPKKSTDERIDVRMSVAQIVKVKSYFDSDLGEEVDHEEVLLHAAARIARVEYHLDEEARDVTGTTLFLTVAVPGPLGQVLYFDDIEILDSDLPRIGLWLARVPGGAGIGVERPTLPQDDIANAIRSNVLSGRVLRTGILARFGWYLPTGASQYLYALPHASIGPEALHRDVVGRPPQRQFHVVEAEDTFNLDPERIKQAVSSLIGAADQFTNPIQWWVALAVIGLSFLPITPMAAVGFFGPRSSGKSTIAQGMSTALSKKWAPPGTPMSTFNGTEAALGMLADGIQNSFLHVDDFRPGASRRKTEEALEALDSLLRRSYGSIGRQRGMFDRKTSKVGMADSNDAQPLVVITGEEVPTGGDLADSGLDRMFVVPMWAGKTFKSREASRFEGDPISSDKGRGSLKDFERLAREGVFQVAGHAYIAHLAQTISKVKVPDSGDNQTPFQVARKRLERLKEVYEGERRRLEQEIADYYGQKLDRANVSTRARTTVASLTLGLWSLLHFASTLGAIEPENIEPTVQKVVDQLVDMTVENTAQIMGGNETPEIDALEAIRSLVSSRQATVDPADITGSAKLIGERATAAGQPAMLLNHKQIAGMLRFPGGPRRLAAVLKPLSIPANDGGATRSGHIDGVNVRCVAIPLSVWDPTTRSGAGAMGVPKTRSS